MNEKKDALEKLLSSFEELLDNYETETNNEVTSLSFVDIDDTEYIWNGQNMKKV